jgi:phage terminase large subunit
MMRIDINATKVFKWLKDVKERIVVLRGGTRSSKSYSMAQHIILNKLLALDNRVIIIARKTLPALRKTAMKLVIDLIDEYKIPVKFNKSDLELRYKNNLIYFMSLDDPGKIASIDYNDCWLEEAVDFTYADFKQFNFRSSRKGEGNQIFLSFNPVSALHWIKTELIDKRTSGIAEHVSTYKDNIAHLAPEIVKEIEALASQDQNFYRIYGLGEWGVLENLIYPKWQTFNSDPEKFDEITYGVDWGFNHSSAIVKIYWIDGKFIAKEILHQSGLTQQQFVNKALDLIPPELRRKEMYVDSAEPARIQALFNAGFNAHGALKDVIDGISYCKTHFLGITKDSTSGIKELQSYSWKEDKNDNLIDEPIKLDDDFCDAMRYGAYSAGKAYGRGRTLKIAFR